MINIDTLPVSKLYHFLEKSDIGSNWGEMELQTILLHYDIDATQLAQDKVNVCKILKVSPDLFYDDLVFFGHAVTVMNNQEADFEVFPWLTSLEVAFGIVEMAQVLNVDLNNVPKYSTGVKMMIKEVLINDGYSKTVYPFDHIGITGLGEGQSESDTANKEEAIQKYIKGMYDASNS